MYNKKENDIGLSALLRDRTGAYYVQVSISPAL